LAKKVAQADPVELVREKLGEKLYSQFIEANAMDIELYHCAKELLGKRMDALKNRNELLDEFRGRCQLRGGGV